MPDALPPDSLEPIEELVASELDRQHQHLDAADSKAGIVLGFAAALVALASNVADTGPLAARVLADVGTGSAGVAALVALTSFWPRHFDVIDVAAARDDALGRMPESLTRVAILDTRVLAIGSNRALLGLKSQRLKASMGMVFLAATCLGAGTLVT